MNKISKVADLLKKHAEARGQQIAFSGPGQAVTYADLAVRTGRIAVNLQSAGATRGCRVAIVLGGCIEAVESIFATTRASAVGVPLDPRSSQAELAKVLERSCADVIITDSQRLSRVCAAISSLAGETERRRTIVVVDRESNDLKSRVNVIVPDQGFVVRWYEDWAAGSNSEHPAEEPFDDLGLDEPAWLHYTTGTTGEPKGVLSSQRAWMWTAVASYIPSLELTSADKLFWPLPLFHAFGHSLCIIGTLAVGATTHLVGDEPQLASLRQNPETTIIAGAPASFRELVTATTTDVTAREALSQNIT
ncbi:hypothetical protein BDV06DRAFT_22934 [Aspergillus oleicola]